MKLTESRLRTLIEEELSKILDEAPLQRDYNVIEEPIFVRIEGKRYFWPKIKKFLKANPSVDRDMLEKLAREGKLKQYESESIAATLTKRGVADMVKRGIPTDVRGGGPDRRASTGSKYKGGAGFPTMPGGTINTIKEEVVVPDNVKVKGKQGEDGYWVYTATFTGDSGTHRATGRHPIENTAKTMALKNLKKVMRDAIERQKKQKLDEKMNLRLIRNGEDVTASRNPKPGDEIIATYTLNGYEPTTGRSKVRGDNINAEMLAAHEEAVDKMDAQIFGTAPKSDVVKAKEAPKEQAAIEKEKAALRRADTTLGRAQRQATAKPQPQAAKQTTGRRNKINITNMRKGDFIVAIAEYPMRGKVRKQYAQAKIINGNLAAASEKATDEVRKRVEAMLASEPSNAQDQATREKNIKPKALAKRKNQTAQRGEQGEEFDVEDEVKKTKMAADVRNKTILRQLQDPAPADVANAFGPATPGGTGSGAKPVQGNVYAGKSTREILDILKRTTPQRAVNRGIKKLQRRQGNKFKNRGTMLNYLLSLPTSHPARQAYREAYENQKEK